MNATELMLGDWVYDKVLKAKGKVEAIMERKIRCDINVNLCDEDEFRPIAITTARLKKIGWKYYSRLKSGVLDSDVFDTLYEDKFEVIYYPETKQLNILYDDGEQYYDMLVITVNYIHEIQHAFRISGIKTEIQL